MGLRCGGPRSMQDTPSLRHGSWPNRAGARLRFRPKPCGKDAIYCADCWTFLRSRGCEQCHTAVRNDATLDDVNIQIPPEALRHFERTQSTPIAASTLDSDTSSTLERLPSSTYSMASRTFQPNKEIPDLSGKVIFITGGKVQDTQASLRPSFSHSLS